MSVTAIGFRDTRAARFWNAVNGKKAVMAISGAVLFGFVIVHMLGNLQVFLGREAFNHYAELLRVEPALLWAARSVLIVMVILHIWASVKLAALNKLSARPVGYAKKRFVGSNYASRTMYWSGPIIAAFVVYHLMQFTWGIGGTDYDPKARLHQCGPRISGGAHLPSLTSSRWAFLCFTSITARGACSRPWA